MTEISELKSWIAPHAGVVKSVLGIAQKSR